MSQRGPLHCKVSSFIFEIVFALMTMFGCVRYQDNGWQRAIVDSIDENRVTVLFVDYGTLDSVDRRDIRLNILLEEIPIQGFWCTLQNIRLLTEESNFNQKIRDLLFGKVFGVRVEKTGTSIEVVLRDEMASIAKLLVSKKVAEYIKKKNHKKKKRFGAM